MLLRAFTQDSVHSMVKCVNRMLAVLYFNANLRLGNHFIKSFRENLFIVLYPLKPDKNLTHYFSLYSRECFFFFTFFSNSLCSTHSFVLFIFCSPPFQTFSFLLHLSFLLLLFTFFFTFHSSFFFSFFFLLLFSLVSYRHSLSFHFLYSVFFFLFIY